MRLVPVADRGVVRRKQHEDLGLQRIGILKLVHEQPLEAILKAAAHTVVVCHQVPRLEQQVEEIERTGFGLFRLIAAGARAQFPAQQSGEIGVGVCFESRKLGLQLLARTRDVFAEHAPPCRLCRFLCGLAGTGDSGPDR